MTIVKLFFRHPGFNPGSERGADPDFRQDDERKKAQDDGDKGLKINFKI